VLRFATPLDDLDAFVEAFSHLVEDRVLFIVTRHPLRVGLRCQFAVTLKGGAPVLRGEGEVQESPAKLSETSSITGIRLRILRLTPDSVPLYERLIDHRRDRETTLVSQMPRKDAPSAVSAETPHKEERVPHSPFVLPANPLSELTDRALHGMIECAIHEDYTVPPTELNDLITPIPELDRPGRPSMPLPLSIAPEPPAPEPVAAVEPPPPAPPPQIIEVPGPPVKISVGVGAQIVTAVLALAVGLSVAFLAFGTDLLWRDVVPRVVPRVVAVAAPAPAPTPTTAAAAAPAPVPTEPAAEPQADGTDEPTLAATAPDDHSAKPAPGAAADGTCTLTLRGVPDDAHVDIGGNAAGKGPYTDLPVACGEELAISIEHPRYRSFQRKVTPTAGNPVKVVVEMLRPDASLAIASKPAGAILTVDGRVVGRAPATADVSAYTTVYVTATLAGHKVWSKRVRMSKPKMTVTARLEALPGAP